MRYTVIRGDALSSDMASRWARIQETHPQYASPYFRPEFAQCVATVRDDLFVCVLEEGDRQVGFFPFHRSRGGVGRPIGLGLSDYHGVIVESEVEWSVESLLQGCRLIRYEYDHLLACQQQFAQYHVKVAESPTVSLDVPFSLYEARRRELGAKQLNETYRRIRKLEREHGPHSFTLKDVRPTAFQQMIDWKREQCRRTNVVDYFAYAWTRNLIKCIHERASGSFGGQLSTVSLGDQTIAVHFVMYSHRVWHSWFPGYDREFRQYSPGLILLLEMIRAGCDTRVEYMDLGKDVSAWKESFRTNSLLVAEGSAQRRSLRNDLRHWRDRLESWGRTSSLKPLLKFPGRLIKNVERRRRYQ